MANGDKNNGDTDQDAVDAILVEIDFPATRDDLVTAAQDADADEAVVVWFQTLPDEEFTSREDVDKANDKRSGNGS